MKLSIIISTLLLATALAAPRRSEDIAKRLSKAQFRTPKFKPTTFTNSSFTAATGHPVPIIEGPSEKAQEARTDTFYHTYWSGAIVTPPPSGSTFNAIQGEFHIPITHVPAGSPPGTYYVSMWIGLDGWGQNHVFQAGVFVQTVLLSSGATQTQYLAWYEWYPNQLSVINGFPLSVGDDIVVVLNIVNPTRAIFLIENLTKGVSVQSTIRAPNAASALVGASAEWIVEDQSNSAGLVPFLGFDSVGWTNCLAGTSTGGLVSLADATLLLDMVKVNSDGQITQVLTDVTVVDDYTMLVVYTGS